MSRFGRLFPQKTPEEVDRDPAYRKVHAELTTLRDTILNPSRTMEDVLREQAERNIFRPARRTTKGGGE